jgi:hypothetical protein
MRTIAELNVLMRVQTELPNGLKVATEEFREGWNFLRAANAQRLQKKIKTRGWNFIKIAGGSLRSGVGDTSQEAIASALKLALRRLGAHLNAVEVEHIELTHYPWFYLARVRVSPYRIQQGPILQMADEAASISNTIQHRLLPVQSAALFPHFGSAMPMLKEMLISSASLEARVQ